MTHAPKRRWFRVSLRTMFVAVTVLCVWLAYEWRWIRQRDEFLAWRDNQERHISGRQFASTSDYGLIQEPQDPPRQLPLHSRLVLWAFGRPQIQFLQLVFIGDDNNIAVAGHDEHVAQAVNLFPEAAIAVAVKQSDFNLSPPTGTSK